MGIERVDIGNAIIAGIGAADTPLEQMSEITSAIERAGFVIVPKEPTEEMRIAGNREEAEQFDPKNRYLSASKIFRAMIDAAHK